MQEKNYLLSQIEAANTNIIYSYISLLNDFSYKMLFKYEKVSSRLFHLSGGNNGKNCCMFVILQNLLQGLLFRNKRKPSY